LLLSGLEQVSIMLERYREISDLVISSAVVGLFYFKFLIYWFNYSELV